MINKYFACFFILLTSCLFSPITFGLENTHNIGRLAIQNWVTQQGVRVFFVHSPELNMLDLRLIFPAGSVYDQDQFGLANLSNEALITGTKKLNADQIATQFDQLGSLITHETTRDYAIISLRSLNAPLSLDPTIKLLTEVLNTPSFSAEQLMRLKKQNLRAIQANEQSPASLASTVFFKSLYGKHGYGHPVLGLPQTITRLTRNNLMDFYKDYYTANNASLVLVGNITDLQAKAIAEQLSAALPKQKTPTPLDTPQKSIITQATQAHCQAVNFPSAQANILIGSIGIAHNDPDFFPLVIGNHIMGGSPLTSRLFQEVRNKKGLAYSVYSSFMPYKEQGPFLISLQSRNEKAGEAIRIIQDTLSKFIQEGPSNEELASAKRNLIGKFNVNLASNSAIADALSTLAFYELPLDYFDNYAKKIQQVTVEQIIQAMKKHLYVNQLSTVIIGKASCN